MQTLAFRAIPPSLRKEHPSIASASGRASPNGLQFVHAHMFPRCGSQCDKPRQGFHVLNIYEQTTPTCHPPPLRTPFPSTKILCSFSLLVSWPQDVSFHSCYTTFRILQRGYFRALGLSTFAFICACHRKLTHRGRSVATAKAGRWYHDLFSTVLT